MTQPPLRFVHAADLHLERPLSGVAEVPAHLREQFLEAPYIAARQVFETALAEGVDALLLSGDLLHIERAGPRAIVFLVEHLQRLADQGVTVYWAGGQVDPTDAWPPTAVLPDRVHRFPAGQVTSIEHRRDGRVVARIQGISRVPGQPLDDTGFYRDAHGAFTIGVAHGTAAAAGNEGDRVHYMALGGQHRRQTVDQSPGIAHYAGTPQGRNPSETGPCGCTLVTVDESGHLKTTFVATDVVRWISETIELTASSDQDALYSQMQQRTSNLRTKHPDRTLLVTWQVTGSGQLLNRLRNGGLNESILADLRRDHGHGAHPVWSVGIQCREPLFVPDEWYDEETIRGDVLRQFRELQSSDATPLGLEEFLPAELRTGPYAELAAVDAGDRVDLIVSASKLAMELLELGASES